jgi:hypothetical protein
MAMLMPIKFSVRPESKRAIRRRTAHLPSTRNAQGENLGHRVGDVAQHVADLAADCAHGGDGGH